VVIGSVDRIEVWDADAYESYLSEHEADFAEGDDDALSGFL
jgi:MraZ protein